MPDSATSGADELGPRSEVRTGTRSRRHRRTVRILVTSMSFAVVLAVVSGTTAMSYYKYYNGRIVRQNVLNTKDTNIKQADRQLHAANYLVLGSDSRAGDGTAYGNVEGARSDTAMLVHLSPDRTKATVISIPRDSVVDIPACADGKGNTIAEHTDLFNAAFGVGGAACTIATVQKLTGIAITHFVSINFSGFISVINALGSITVCSPQAVPLDPLSGLQLVQGNNKLNGTQALAYVRARETLADGSDLARIQRQQRFLGAVLREVRGGKLLSDPAALTSFLNAATKAITLDSGTSLLDLKQLFDVLRGLDPTKVTFYTAPIARSNYDPTDPSNPNGSHVLLDAAKGKILYDEIINDQTITVGGKTTPTPIPTPTASVLTVAPALITVQVTNGVGTPNLATNVSAALVAKGFQAGELNMGDGSTTATTVLFNATQFAAAQTVAAAFPNSTMQLATGHTGAIEVLVGTDYTSVNAVAVGNPLPSWVLKTVPKATSTSTAAAPTGISASDATCTNG